MYAAVYSLGFRVQGLGSPHRELRDVLGGRGFGGADGSLGIASHPGVAVQVAFESKRLRTGDHFIGRLKGQAQGLRTGAFKLWVKPDSTCTQPHHGRHGFPQARQPPLPLLGVALQVAFERQVLTPAFHLIGYRLWV
jgi:hypothetical protein